MTRKRAFLFGHLPPPPLTAVIRFYLNSRPLPPLFRQLNFVPGSAMTDAIVSLFLTLSDIYAHKDSRFFLRTESPKVRYYALTLQTSVSLEFSIFLFFFQICPIVIFHIIFHLDQIIVKDTVIAIMTFLGRYSSSVQGKHHPSNMKGPHLQLNMNSFTGIISWIYLDFKSTFCSEQFSVMLL